MLEIPNSQWQQVATISKIFEGKSHSVSNSALSLQIGRGSVVHQKNIQILLLHNSCIGEIYLTVFFMLTLNLSISIIETNQ